MLGRTISHFEVLEKIGEGGMGVVYRGRDVMLDRQVALKFMPADKLPDANRRRRFIQEARAASALNHPNIVTIYEIVTLEDSEVISMELVRGKTLSQLIANRMRQSEAHPLRDPNRRRPIESAQRRYRSPRPQTRQHHDYRCGCSEASRLRPGETA